MAAIQTDAEVRARLRAYLSGNESLLRAALDRARSAHDHPGVKGELVESSVRAFLASHLPARLSVGHGEVIDRFGARSKQMDVLVINDDHPFRHADGDPGLYLAEGVVAAAEVKASLGSSELGDMLTKGTRFRAVHPVANNGDTRQAPSASDASRFYASPPYFGIALESKLSGRAIMDKLVRSSDCPSPEDPAIKLPALDALFTLDQGVFINFGDGQGSFSFIDPRGIPAAGWVWLGKEEPLVHLFTWLHAVMPRIRRWSSIAVPYLSFLGSPDDVAELLKNEPGSELDARAHREGGAQER